MLMTLLMSLCYAGAPLHGATELSLQSPGAGNTFGAVSGAWPCRVQCIQESSSYMQEVCNYSVLRQKAPEQECKAGSLSIEIQVFNER